MTEKPRGRPPVSPQGGKDAGHLGMDDRGNVTWQWSSDVDQLPEDTLGATERIRALVDPDLAIRDDETDPSTPGESIPKGLKTGYNPYSSGALGKKSRKKKKDLRELSKWVELRKNTAGNKGDD